MAKFIELTDENGNVSMLNLNSISQIFREGLPLSMTIDETKPIKSCSVIFIGETERKVITNINYEELKNLIFEKEK